MSSQQVPPDSIFLKWGRFQLIINWSTGARSGGHGIDCNRSGDLVEGAALSTRRASHLPQNGGGRAASDSVGIPMPPGRDNPSLLKTREEAQRLLRERIDKAIEIVPTDIRSYDDLEAAKTKEKLWYDYNCQLLSNLFST